MRDIRPDLQERAASIKDQIAGLKAELSKKEQFLASTEELLARETEYWANQDDLFGAKKNLNGEKPPLIQFLKDTLSHGNALTLQEISKRALAQGYDFEGKAPGRAIHFRLIGLKRSNLAEKDGDYWRMIDSG